jgi:SAM-dependent methyltransferase
MHPNSQRLFETYAKPYFRNGMRVLEIAPESHPSTLCRTVNDASITWESINLEPEDKNYVIPKTPGMIVTHKAYEYPIRDNTYDIVASANVFEHVPMPWKWMRELARVCKPGGYVVTVAPLNWGYHAQPIDCWRAYPDAMKGVYEDASLTVEKALFETTDTWKSRANIAGLKYVVKRIIGWPVEGEPWHAMDTICVGRKG